MAKKLDGLHYHPITRTWKQLGGRHLMIGSATTLKPWCKGKNICKFPYKVPRNFNTLFFPIEDPDLTLKKKKKKKKKRINMGKAKLLR